jgi:excisionase family DNA binding protein
MNSPKLLTDGEAAELLRILRSRLVRMARDGIIPYVALPDGEIRFDPQDLADWIASHKQIVSGEESAADDR